MLPNYGMVGKTLVSRSGQPDAAGFKRLSKEVEKVIKLTTNLEYSDTKESKQLTCGVYLYPMDALSGQSDFDTAERAAKTLHRVADLDNRRIHVHCHLGRDRTGLVVGIYRLRYCGVSMRAVRRDWATFGVPFKHYCDYLEKIAKTIK